MVIQEICAWRTSNNDLQVKFPEKLPITKLNAWKRSIGMN